MVDVFNPNIVFPGLVYVGVLVFIFGVVVMFFRVDFRWVVSASAVVVNVPSSRVVVAMVQVTVFIFDIVFTVRCGLRFVGFCLFCFCVVCWFWCFLCNGVCLWVLWLGVNSEVFFV